MTNSESELAKGLTPRVDEIALRHEMKALTANEANAQFNDLLRLARQLEGELQALSANKGERVEPVAGWPPLRIIRVAIEHVIMEPDEIDFEELKEAQRLVISLLNAPPADSEYRRGLESEVIAEVEKAVAKFPTWPTDPLHALAVLGEEFGELTKAVLQFTYEPHKTNANDIHMEAVQTAAMALRFLKSLDAYQYERCEQHEQGAT